MPSVHTDSVWIHGPVPELPPGLKKNASAFAPASCRWYNDLKPILQGDRRKVNETDMQAEETESGGKCGGGR